MKFSLPLSAIRDRLVPHRSHILSLVLHISLLLLLTAAVRHAPQTVPMRIPGTRAGLTVLTWYSPGSTRTTQSNVRLPKVEKKINPSDSKPKPRSAEIQQTPTAQSQLGVGNSAQSGLGDGDITIALETYFPYPKPDLSSMPHGTEGDVILDAVVDEQGKISQLKLLKGLGPAIDEVVIATVQQWSYTPAKRNGVPIPSEREIHFHYQRG